MADYLTRPKQAKTSMLLFYNLICANLFVFWSVHFSLVFLVAALTIALASGQRSRSVQGREDVKHTFGRAYEVSVVDALRLYVGGDVVFKMVFWLLGFRVWVEVWVCV